MHRDSDQSGANAAGVRLEQNGVMYPMMLQVLHLRTFCYGDADAVVADWKYRYAELEQGLEPLPRTHAYRPACVSDAGIITEQRLPKPILHEESHDGRGDTGVGFAAHAERNVFAAHAPAKALALRIPKLHLCNRGPALTEARAVRVEQFDIISEFGLVQVGQSLIPELRLCRARP